MKDNSGFYIPVVSALVLMGAVLCVYALAHTPEDWAAYICKPEDCTLQSWLAATAGWVGFAAAATGAFWVYGQLAEQRKQTAFLLGDGDPTVDLVSQPRTKLSGRLQFTNWNRRTYIKKEIILTAKVPLPNFVRFTQRDSAGSEETYSTDVRRDGSLRSFPKIL